MGFLLFCDVVVESSVKDPASSLAECVDTEGVALDCNKALQAGPQRVVRCVAGPKEGRHILAQLALGAEFFIRSTDLPCRVKGGTRIEEAHASAQAERIALQEKTGHVRHVQSTARSKIGVGDLEGTVLARARLLLETARNGQNKQAPEDWKRTQVSNHPRASTIVVRFHLLLS